MAPKLDAKHWANPTSGSRVWTPIPQQMDMCITLQWWWGCFHWFSPKNVLGKIELYTECIPLLCIIRFIGTVYIIYIYMHLVSLPLPRRHNMYDGSEEFWVVVKETGKRQESQSYEEIHAQNKEAGCLVIHSPLFLSCACVYLYNLYIQHLCFYPYLKIQLSSDGQGNLRAHLWVGWQVQRSAGSGKPSRCWKG